MSPRSGRLLVTCLVLTCWPLLAALWYNVDVNPEISVATLESFMGSVGLQGSFLGLFS